MFLNRRSRAVHLVVTLMVTAWLSVCGQSCAEATAAAPAKRAAVGMKDIGAGTFTGRQAARGNAPHHRLNDPDCDSTACCAKMAQSNHGKQPVPPSLTLPPVAEAVLYTLPRPLACHAVAPTARQGPVPTLSPLQRTGVLRL